jgi:AcrR family transcriptional regulator
MPDRRVHRTRRTLHAALVDLILERGWDRVSVADVCARAGVGRSTFYVHYADKEDLLIGGLDLVRDRIRAASTRPFGFLDGLFEHVDESRRLFRAVIGKKSGLAVQRRFRAIVLELIEGELAKDDPIVARYLAGALVEILIWWVEVKRPVPAATVQRRFTELATAALRA